MYADTTKQHLWICFKVVAEYLALHLQTDNRAKNVTVGILVQTAHAALFPTPWNLRQKPYHILTARERKVDPMMRPSVIHLQLHRCLAP